MSTEEALPEGLVGSANYSSRQYEQFKLKKADDAFQFRPLPPMSPTLKKRKVVGIYWKTHFGWKGLDEKGKERLRPFLCIEEKRDGRITCVCDACGLRKTYEDRKAALFGKKKSIEEFGFKAKKTPAEIRKVLAPVEQELKDANDWLYDHGLDGKFRLPCINRQGKIGIFLMPFGAMKKFQERCRELSQKLGVDPCGVKGLWFEATRNGQASRDSDDVQAVKIFDKDTTTERYDFHTLDNATLLAASQAIPDLGDLMEKQRITPEQIAALVNCGDDPEEVDRILGISERRAAAASDEESAPVDESSIKAATDMEDPFGPPETVKTETKVEVKETAPAVETAAAAEDDDEAEMAALQAKIAAKKAAKASADAATRAKAAETSKIETKAAPPAAKAETKKTETKKAQPEPADAVGADEGNFEALFNA